MTLRILAKEKPPPTVLVEAKLAKLQRKYEKLTGLSYTVKEVSF